MIRKSVLGVIIAGFFLLAFILTWVSLSQASSTEETPNLETCSPVHTAGIGKPSIVFFSTASQAKDYTNYLFSLSPFDELKDDLNVYVIDDYKPTCRLYNDIALYCYSKDIVEKAASCPSVRYIVAAEEKPARIRSSAYMQVASINTEVPRSVLAHELGHVIAHLAEEYDAGIDPPFSSDNCQSSCDAFAGPTDGCFEVCSNGDYKRSIESGIMRSLSANTLGTFNEQLIKAKIESLPTKGPTGQAVVEDACEDQSYWLIETVFEKGQARITNQEKKHGCAPTVTAGDVKYETSQGAIIIETNEFNPLLLFTDGEGHDTIDGQTVTLSDTTVYLAIPETTNADTLSITDQDDMQIAYATLVQEGTAACKVA